jgi:flagellar assembly factor FliW
MNNPENISLSPVESEVLNKSVSFPLGIPGFVESKHFVFVQRSEEHPFAWMRSIEEPELGFAVVEAYHLMPDFSFEVDDKELEVIGSPSPENCAVFFIIKLERSAKVKITANTRAPILINIKDRKGRQVILPSDKPTSEVMTFEF